MIVVSSSLIFFHFTLIYLESLIYSFCWFRRKWYIVSLFSLFNLNPLHNILNWWMVRIPKILFQLCCFSKTTRQSKCRMSCNFKLSAVTNSQSLRPRPPRNLAMVHYIIKLRCPRLWAKDFEFMLSEQTPCRLVIWDKMFVHSSHCSGLSLLIWHTRVNYTK